MVGNTWATYPLNTCTSITDKFTWDGGVERGGAMSSSGDFMPLPRTTED